MTHFYTLPNAKGGLWEIHGLSEPRHLFCPAGLQDDGY